MIGKISNYEIHKCLTARITNCIVVTLATILINGCASKVAELRYLESDRSAYYPLAIVSSETATDFSGRSYRLADKSGRGLEICFAGTIVSFGLLAPLCVLPISEDIATEVKIAEFNKKFEGQVEGLKPRIKRIADVTTLRNYAVSYLLSHDAKVDAIANDTLPEGRTSIRKMLAQSGYKSMLEFLLLSFDFSERETSEGWAYCLSVRVATHVFSITDNKSLGREEFQQTKCGPLGDWIKDQAFELAAEKLYEDIAKSAVDRILLLHKESNDETPAVSALFPKVKRVGKGNSKSPAYKPKTRADYHACCFLKFSVVGLQPRFEWTPYVADQLPLISYDIQVREGRVFVPLWLGGRSGYHPGSKAIVAGDVVYARDNLLETGHQMEIPLEPCRWYFWSVRVRYRLNGFPRVSPWSAIVFPWLTRSPSYPSSPYPIRTAAGPDEPSCWSKPVNWDIRKGSSLLAGEDQ